LEGDPVKPASNEQCWKDTIQADAGSITVIRIRFASQDGSNYQFDPTVGPGYVWHCHILDHEDNEMMRPLIIMGSNNPLSLVSDIALIAIAVIVVVGALVIFKYIRRVKSRK
jgi:hypothetical protein